MLVEFAGIPGSGKSTLKYAIMKELTNRSISYVGTKKVSARASPPGTVPRFSVERKPERIPLYRFSRFSRSHPDYVEMIAKLFDENDVQQYFMHLLLAANFQAALDAKEDGEFVLFDEGFLSYGVVACRHANQIEKLASIITVSPEMDAIVLVRTPPVTAHQRAIDRMGGGNRAKKKVISKFGTVSDLESHEAILQQGLKYYQSRSKVVLSVDGTENTEKNATSIVDELQELQVVGFE